MAYILFVKIITLHWCSSPRCRPFFWNVKAMYEQKTVGLRQHHCRRCGKAVCDYCSSKRSILTDKGHEYPVRWVEDIVYILKQLIDIMHRVCEECYISIKEGEKKPLANFFDTRSSNIFLCGTLNWQTSECFRNVVKHLHFDASRCLLASVGQDNVIKLWQMREVLEGQRMTGP